MPKIESVYLDKQTQILNLEKIIGHCKKQFLSEEDKDPQYLETWRACLSDIMEIERREEARMKYREDRQRQLERERDRGVLRDLIEE